MFRRTEEEIIEIVGQALIKGHRECPELIRGTGEINVYDALRKIVIYSKNTKVTQIDLNRIVLKALLEHLGLEFKTKHNVIVKKKEQKKHEKNAI